MRTLRTTIPTLLTVALAATQVGATDCGQIIDDPGFDLWCGDTLCAWKLERGEIRAATSWHQGDDAVELLGADTAISQLTPVNNYDTHCIRFDLVADVAESTEVRLEGDVFGDGTVDWSERIPTSAWAKVSYRIRIDGAYDGVLFRLTKRGAGRAVLARIAAETADDCGYPGIELPPRPDGALCAVDGDCASGTCWNGFVCSDCDADADCAPGDVCGRARDVPGNLQPWLTCVPEGAGQLGEPCVYDPECASGICTAGSCGECDASTACPGGEVCTSRTELGVRECGSTPRASGAPCFIDDDCVSGACDGTPIGFCDDASWIPRMCGDDTECPAGSDLTPGACTFVGAAGGTCQ
ncbi:MAG: hypothetical protein H6708_06280 [Kofleriaceae bacterium]|nr:hypothetical protein [Kofleriaceae bacterium]